MRGHAGQPVSVDIVVPVFGGWEYLEDCVRALLAQTHPARIFIVDDVSPDDTPDRVAATFHTVNVLRNTENSGFAVTCNRGIRAGDAEIVVLINSDVVASPVMVERIVRRFEEDVAATVGSVSPILRDGDGRVDAYGVCVDATLAGFTRFHGASIADLTEDAPPSAGPYGALAAYRRSALDAVGLLDENIFMYGEELELSLRLSNGGWQTASISEHLGTHIGAATVGVRSPRQRYLAGFGRGYTLRRYGVLRSRFACRALVTEAIVIGLGLVRRADTAALKGRLAGWRKAHGLPRLAYPRLAVAPEIGFLESLKMRAPGYWQGYRSAHAVGRAR